MSQTLASAIEKCMLGIHIRFCFCNLSSKAITDLAEAIEVNRSLSGFSCMQNPCSFDTSGMLLTDAESESRLKHAVFVSAAPLKIFNNQHFEREVRKFIEYSQQHPNIPSTSKAELLAGWKDCVEETRHLLDIPGAVLRKGPVAIKRFFRLAKDGGVDPTFRLVAMVLGKAAVGKTSLIRSIRDNNRGRPVPEGDDRATIGVERHTLGGVVDNDNKATELIVLDFGGQEDYYASHTAFHRSSGIVLVAFDLSTYQPSNFENFCYFFIKKTNASVPGVRFILVGTKSDRVTPKTDIENRCQDAIKTFRKLEADVVKAIRSEQECFSPGDSRHSELEALATNRPQLLLDKVLVVSCKRRPKALLGLGAELKAIGISDLSNALRGFCTTIGHQLPLSYIRFRDRLISERNRRAFSSLRDILEMAKSYGFNNETDTRAALAVFHDVNDVLWYAMNARVSDVVFIDPEFVMNIIKPLVRHDLTKNDEGSDFALNKILKNPELDETLRRLKTSGMIPLGLIRESFPVWKDLDSKMFDNFLSLMEIFGIGYEVDVPGGEPMLLLPSHVGVDLNLVVDDVPVPENSPLRLTRAWEFVHFSPSGLMVNLAVAFHDIHRNEGKFYFRPGLVVAHTLSGDVIVDTRIRATFSDTSKVRLELQVRCSSLDEVRMETKKASEKIEEFLAGFPGMMIKRLGVDPSSNTQVDLDMARIQAGQGKSHLQSDDGLRAISMEGILPEEYIEAKFTQQPSFREGLPSFVPFQSESSEFHFFLSHYQKEFGDACANVDSLLKKQGVMCWFDKRAKNITGDSMALGIEQSDSYVLFLSTGVLTRRWVRFELLTAIKMEKPIVLVLDNDARRAPFDLESLDSEKVVPLTVDGEADVTEKYFRRKSFRDMIKLLLAHSECIAFQRRLPFEGAMITLLVDIAKDTEEIKRRVNVTKKLKQEMCW